MASGSGAPSDWLTHASWPGSLAAEVPHRRPNRGVCGCRGVRDLHGHGFPWRQACRIERLSWSADVRGSRMVECAVAASLPTNPMRPRPSRGGSVFASSRNRGTHRCESSFLCGQFPNATRQAHATGSSIRHAVFCLTRERGGMCWAIAWRLEGELPACIRVPLPGENCLVLLSEQSVRHQPSVPGGFTHEFNCQPKSGDSGTAVSVDP